MAIGSRTGHCSLDDQGIQKKLPLCQLTKQPFVNCTRPLWNLSAPSDSWAPKSSEKSSEELVWANMHNNRIRKMGNSKGWPWSPFYQFMYFSAMECIPQCFVRNNYKRIQVAWLSTTFHVIEENEERVQLAYLKVLQKHQGRIHKVLWCEEGLWTEREIIEKQIPTVFFIMESWKYRNVHYIKPYLAYHGMHGS